MGRRIGWPHLYVSAFVLCLMIGLHQFNYLLFHSFVEVLSIVVACGIFILAWHTQKILENSFFFFIGIAYLFIGGLDFVHTLAYPGMAVFPELSSDAPVQLWVVTRFIEGLTLLLAPFLINKRPRPLLWGTLFAMVVCVTLMAIFVWSVIPQCYIPGKGLTLFKITSEYIIVLILLMAIICLYRHKSALDKNVWRLLCAAIALTIASEISFTLYTDVFGFFNMVGHCIKFISVFLVYLAIIETGLVRPHLIAIQALQQKETAIQEREAVFKTIINASTDIVLLLDHQLRFVAANTAATHAFQIAPHASRGRPIGEILPSGKCNIRLDFAKQVLVGGQAVQYEEPQNERVLLNSIYPIANDQGEIVQLAIFIKDITKQREAHQALAESEARFRMLAERIEEVFWIATPDARRFTYVSPAYETITGRSCEELSLGTKELMAMIHPDDRYDLQAAAKRLPLNEWEIEFRLVRPDGAVRWVQNRGYAIYDDQGHIVQICGVARDITDRKNLAQRLVAAHHELEQRVEDRTTALSVAIQQLKHQVSKRTKMGNVIKEKHSMLNTLLQAIPDRVSFKDPGGRYQLANDAFKVFFGLKDKRLSGQTDADLKSPDIARLAEEKDLQVIEKGRALQFESHLPSESGPLSHWDVHKVPVKDSNDTIIGILSISRDITEYKQRETQLEQSKAILRAFLDGISEPMVMMDQNLTLVYINRAATLAYPNSDGKHRGKTCYGMLCDGQRACSECVVPGLVSQKERHSFEQINTANSERIEMVDIYPLSQDQDGLNGAIVRIRDITQAKHVERQMIHGEKMASLGMLISGIAHEINNPNSFITFNLPILKAYLEKILAVLDAHPDAISHLDWFGMNYSEFRQELFSLLDNLSHGSIRIDNIIGNLKTMAHPKPPDQRCTWTNIQEVIDKAVTLCRSEIRKHVRTFDVEPSPVVCEAYADPEGLEQVLINLLINAAQAVDKTDSWIRLRSIPPDNEHRFAVIEVHDNGCGMDPVTRDSVFDPFFTTKAPGVGTGLGLSMSYNLVGQMGGQIRVESTLGHGTKFIIRLPINIEKHKTMAQHQQQRAS